MIPETDKKIGLKSFSVILLSLGIATKIYVIPILGYWNNIILVCTNKKKENIFMYRTYTAGI